MSLFASSFVIVPSENTSSGSHTTAVSYKDTTEALDCFAWVPLPQRY